MDFKKAVVAYLLSEDREEQQAAERELRKYLGNAGRPPVDEKGELIRRCLIDLGCPGYMSGYPILVRAIEIAVDNPKSIKGVVAGLYVSLGQEFGVSGSVAEKRIRAVIDTGWIRCDPDVAASYFGGTISPEKGKPTTRQFIVCVADTVRQRSKEEI